MDRAGEAVESEQHAGDAPPGGRDVSRDPLLVYDNELHVDPQRTVKLVRCTSAVAAWATCAGLLVVVTFAASLRVRLGLGGPWWTGVAQVMPMFNVTFGLIVVMFAFWKATSREKDVEKAAQALPYELAWHDRDVFRLAVSGEKGRLVQMFAKELPDEFFEPRVIRMWGAVPLEGRKRYFMLWGVSCVLTCMALYVMRLVTGTTNAWTQLIMFEVLGAIGLSWLPTLLLWPVYLRIAPGSLEVLRFSMWGGRVIRRDAFDLRTARVRLMPWQIFVQPVGQRMHQIDCPWSWASRNFMRDVLMAARWRGELPPLPADRLSQ